MRVDFEYKKCLGIRSYNPTPEIETKKIDEAISIINKAKKPLLVWGQGVILGKAEGDLISGSDEKAKQRNSESETCNY